MSQQPSISTSRSRKHHDDPFHKQLKKKESDQIAEHLFELGLLGEKYVDSKKPPAERKDPVPGPGAAAEYPIKR
jgi:hypothetical protein